MRRYAVLLIAALLGALISTPIAVWASHRFTDVPDSHTFHNAIDWLADNGITVGCNPPVNDRFCPDDNVTRAQMAAFMKRLAENQVVDADTVDGLQGSQLLTTTDPLDADTLDGVDSSQLLTTTDPLDADTLDGVDSTQFLGTGPVVLSMPATAWVPRTTGTPTQLTIDPVNGTFSSGSMLMTIPTPAIIGGVGYGLDQLQFCYIMSDSSTEIGFLAVYRTTLTGNDIPFTDSTQRNQTALTCETLDINALPGKGLVFEVSTAGPGTTTVTSVTATWTSDLSGFS